MKTNFLLPGRFKIWGWILFIPGSILGVLYMLDFRWPDFFDVFDVFDNKVLELEINFNATAQKIIDISLTDNNIFDEILSIMIIVGGLLISFAKEKDEDEFTSKIRSESLIWAILLNYSILLLATLFIYGESFLTVMTYGIFTPLIFFILRFNWLLGNPENL